MSESRVWRAISGGELLAFVRGKTVASMDPGEHESTVTFTDGSAIRCTPIDGTVYSEHSADSATVEWEAFVERGVSG